MNFDEILDGLAGTPHEATLDAAERALQGGGDESLISAVAVDLAPHRPGPVVAALTARLVAGRASPWWGEVAYALVEAGAGRAVRRGIAEACRDAKPGRSLEERAALAELAGELQVDVDAMRAALSQLPEFEEESRRLAEGNLDALRKLAIATDPAGAVSRALATLRQGSKDDPLHWRSSLVDLARGPQTRDQMKRGLESAMREDPYGFPRDREVASAIALCDADARVLFGGTRANRFARKWRAPRR